MPLRRRIHRRGTYRTPSQTVTSSTGSSKNYVRTVTHTPSDEEVEEESRETSLSVPKGLSGTPGMVVLLGGTLLVTATYDDFWKPYFNSLWTGAALKTNIDGRLILGGILFIVIAAVIASTSPEAGGIMILMFIAAWLVYIVQGTGGKQLTTFFNWFGPGSITGGSATSAGSSTNPNPKPGGAGHTVK